MSKVALVFPYFRTRAQTEMLFPSLGLASLAAQLEKRRIETRIFDGTFQTMSLVKKELQRYKPDIVGVSSMILLSRNAMLLADYVNEHLPEALLVVGGPMPTLYPQLYSGHFDLVFRGEADKSFPDFCQDYFTLSHGKKGLLDLNLAEYPGLYAHSLDWVVDNPTIHYSEEEIQTFPLPERSGFNHSSYQQAWMEKDGTKTTSILITFGCPFDCDFCSRPVFGHLYRQRRMDMVFEEITEIKHLGYDHLWIADDNFTLSLRYLRQFCLGMAGLGMNWSCLSRASGITLEIAQLMKGAGCQKVFMGLETGCNDTLRLMNKKLTVEEGIQAVHHFRQAGIQVAAFFIVGYPGESIASIEQTFNFALNMPFDDISFNVPFPLPGSKLFDRVNEIDLSKEWRRENEITFVYSSEFDPKWIRKRIQQTMQEFKKRKTSNTL